MSFRTSLQHVSWEEKLEIARLVYNTIDVVQAGVVKPLTEETDKLEIFFFLCSLRRAEIELLDL